MAEALDFLVTRPCLIECELDVVFSGAIAFDVNCSPAICRLVLGLKPLTSTFLDHISLPALVHHHISWLESIVGVPILATHFIPFVSRSSCSLRTLVLLSIQDSIRDDDLIQCLEAIPTLTGFTLHFESCTSNATGNLLNRMTSYESSPECLVPKLEKIEFDLY